MVGEWTDRLGSLITYNASPQHTHLLTYVVRAYPIISARKPAQTDMYGITTSILRAGVSTGTGGRARGTYLPTSYST